MPYNLTNRSVLVTGGSKGLGAVICRRFAQEGCNVAINYSSDNEAAEKLAEDLKQFGGKVICIKADAGNLEDCARCVQETISAFGGIDVLIGNAGWTRFSNPADLNSSTEADWDKCYAVNVKGQMALLRAALPTFNTNEEGGVFIMTNSIAGVCGQGSSLPYVATKGAQLQMMKSLAMTQGPKVRVNAVLPGLLLTEWGEKFGAERIKQLEGAAMLKKATDLEDCADAYVMLAKNTSMTGIKVQIDSGLAIQSA